MATPARTTPPGLLGPAVRAPPWRLSGCLGQNTPRGSCPPASKYLWAIVFFTGVLTHRAWIAPHAAPCTVTPGLGPGRAVMSCLPAVFAVTNSDALGPDPGDADRSLHFVPSTPRKPSTSCPSSPTRRLPSVLRWTPARPRKVSPDPSTAHGVPRSFPTTNSAPPSPLSLIHISEPTRLLSMA